MVNIYPMVSYKQSSDQPRQKTSTMKNPVALVFFNFLYMKNIFDQKSHICSVEEKKIKIRTFSK